MSAEELQDRLADISGNGVFCTVRELLFEGQKSKGVNLHLRHQSRAVRTGSKRSSVRGRGMEFFESRPYVPQDEMRSIDWKVSARLNTLFTKIFVEERDRPIYVAVDLRSSMFFGSINCFKSVLAARLAARLATAAINGGDHIGGLIFDNRCEIECAIKGGQKNLARFLGMLAAKTIDLDSRLRGNDNLIAGNGISHSSWSAVLKRIINRLHPGAAVFLVSDFFDLDHEVRHLLFRLRKKADVFALLIVDPLEEKLPELGTVGMAYGDQKIVFDSNNMRLQKKYLQWRRDSQGDLQAMFSSLDIPMIKFSTATDPDLGMRRVFLGQW